MLCCRTTKKDDIIIHIEIYFFVEDRGLEPNVYTYSILYVVKDTINTRVLSCAPD